MSTLWLRRRGDVDYETKRRDLGEEYVLGPIKLMVLVPHIKPHLTEIPSGLQEGTLLCRAWCGKDLSLKIAQFGLEIAEVTGRFEFMSQVLWNPRQTSFVHVNIHSSSKYGRIEAQALYYRARNKKGTKAKLRRQVRIFVFCVQPPLFCFAVLGMKVRALCVLGKCSTTELHPPVLVVFIIIKTIKFQFSCLYFTTLLMGS